MSYEGEILDAVAGLYGVSVADLTGRAKVALHARAVAIAAILRLTGCSHGHAGQFFGRDAGTAIHYARQCGPGTPEASALEAILARFSGRPLPDRVPALGRWHGLRERQAAELRVTDAAGRKRLAPVHRAARIALLAPAAGMTRPEAAAWLGVSRQTVCNLLCSHGLVARPPAAPEPPPDPAARCRAERDVRVWTGAMVSPMYSTAENRSAHVSLPREPWMVAS